MEIKLSKRITETLSFGILVEMFMLPIICHEMLKQEFPAIKSALVLWSLCCSATIGGKVSLAEKVF
jgi:hypothetical protein